MSRFYACQHINEEIRKNSASGGVFSALAECIIQQGGIVYGAAFNKDYRTVHHIGITSLSEIPLLRGSKYISSKAGSIYKTIKKNLEDGQKVLFSGTPCQIAGLKRFVGDNENLICVDIVCHGVAEEKVYIHYLNYLEQLYHSKISYVTFRDKSTSWKKSDVIFRFENGDKLREPVIKNSFMRGFIANLYLRDTCIKCKYKSFSSGSDLTLGDFWGSTEIPELSIDDTGLSIVSVHTLSGADLFQRIRPQLQSIKELKEKDAFIFNESYRQCASHHPGRNEFYSKYQTEEFNHLVFTILNSFQMTNKKKSLYTQLKNRFIHGLKHISRLK